MTDERDKMLERLHTIRPRKTRPELPPPDERRAIRKRAGLTQDEMAEVVRTSRRSILRWELGQREPRRSARNAYAEALALLADD